MDLNGKHHLNCQHDTMQKTNQFYIDEIQRLKRANNVVILAHYYQRPEIQDLADYVGDSLGLAIEASRTNASIIVFAGVHFMAETAKIINPSKMVLLPDVNAGCSLADSCQTSDFKQFLANYPSHVVVTYVNCSAEIKALSDYVCTSSNAVKIINSIPENKGIVFAPDKNLGRYLIKETGRDIVLWDGACVVHEAFAIDKIIELKKQFPDAIFVAHPESEAHVLEIASFIGSTAALIDFISNSTETTFIVATEAGILHELRNKAPEKQLIPAPSFEDNTCSCSECAYMKVNTLEKLYSCLLHKSPEIVLDKALIDAANIPIQRMLNLSK
jgi:quinolinate synthase